MKLQTTTYARTPPQVLVTRPLHQAGKIGAKVREAGFMPLSVPAFSIGPPSTTVYFEDLGSAPEEFDYLIFTSANSVTGFDKWLAVMRASWPALPRYCAIGPATRTRLGNFVDSNSVLIPAQYESESLLKSDTFQKSNIRRQRVLIVQGDNGRSVIRNELHRRGATVSTLSVYSRIPQFRGFGELRRSLSRGSLAAALFSSPSGFRHIFKHLDIQYRNALNSTEIIAIGNVTAEAIRHVGGISPVIAPYATEEGLIRCLKERIPPV